jgi:hypothetical protein
MKDGEQQKRVHFEKKWQNENVGIKVKNIYF